MFTVGSIVGTHGLNGEVRVLSRTDFPHLRFAKGSVLTMQGNHLPTRIVHVRSGRLQKNVYVVSFEEINTIDEAEKCRGMDLLVSREQLPDLAEGHYFVRDLIGCTVFSSDDDTILGTLIDVLSPGANDVYVVKNTAGMEILLPAIPECIRKVDIAKKRIDVHVMPGLLD